MTPHLKNTQKHIREVVFTVLCVCVLAETFACRATGEKNAPAQDLPQARIIIPNVDDDNGDGLADAAAEVKNGTADDEWLQILVKPGAALAEGAVLRVEISEPWDQYARVFLGDSTGSRFRLIQGPTAIKPEEMTRKGVRIAVETSDFADAGRSPSFGLKARFETKDGQPISEETIACTVAPFLVSCCLDPVDSIHVVKTKLTERFVSDLEPLVRVAGAELKIFDDAALPEHDIWIQDATEIGYAAGGDRVMHVTLHGNRGEKLDDLFAERSLGEDFGVIRKGNYRGESAEWIDWFGNLEVSPPVVVGDRKYPKGRVYAGTQDVRAMHPAVIAFLEAQGIQTPLLWLDTSWLVIGHVDETVSWVPSKVGRPFRMLIPSTRLAVEILAKAEKDAPGGMVNRGTKRDRDKPGDYERPVADTLKDKALMAAQEFVQKKIDGVRQTLQKELGIADADIIEIPVLFGTSMERFKGRYDAWTTNMVNSLLIGDTFIVPDPHGPLVNGRDVLLQAVKDRLEPIGCKVVAVDNFYPYHRWAGEVHCGTNATRRPPRTRE